MFEVGTKKIADGLYRCCNATSLISGFEIGYDNVGGFFEKLNTDYLVLCA